MIFPGRNHATSFTALSLLALEVHSTEYYRLTHFKVVLRAGQGNVRTTARWRANFNKNTLIHVPINKRVFEMYIFYNWH